MRRPFLVRPGPLTGRKGRRRDRDLSRWAWPFPRTGGRRTAADFFRHSAKILILARTGMHHVERPMKILVIEDDTKLAALIRRGLAESGHIIDLEHDGPSGTRYDR